MNYEEGPFSETKSILKQSESETAELVKALSNAFGPSGLEDEVRNIISEELASEEFEQAVDSIGNLYVRSANSDQSPKILLDAHMDEVSMMVQDIDSNGLITFLPLGGWNPGVLAGTAVAIQSTQESGEPIVGIIGSNPVHFQNTQGNSVADNSSLRADIGAISDTEVLMDGIDLGNFMVPATCCTYDSKRRLFTGKAFDDRIGCVAQILTLENLPQQMKSFVEGVFTVQEEVGERGMMAAVSNLQDCALAICFEGCPADDTIPGIERPQTAMNSGPMIRAMDRSMITHPQWLAFARSCAWLDPVNLQIAVRKGGGTNGGILHTHNIPTIVIGIPVRYAHSPIGFCSMNDLENAVKLALTIIKEAWRLSHEDCADEELKPYEQWIRQILSAE